MYLNLNNSELKLMVKVIFTRAEKLKRKANKPITKNQLCDKQIKYAKLLLYGKTNGLVTDT